MKPGQLLLALATLIATALVSCVTQPVPDIAHHVVMADEDGRPVNPLTVRRMEDLQYIRYLRNLTNHLRESGQSNILIFVHGGLNSKASSINRVNQLYQTITNANYYPIFINWPSGLITSYREHLLRIRQGVKVNMAYGLVTAPFYLMADLGQSVARAPLTIQQHYLATDMKNVTGRDTPYDKTAEQITWSDRTFTYFNPGVLNAGAYYAALTNRYALQPETNVAVSLGTYKRTVVEDIPLGTWFVLTTPAKFLTMPVIDALGKNAWDNMLRRTKMLYRKRQEFDISDVRADPDMVNQALDSPPSGVLSQFLNSLSEVITNQPGRYEITLVGHSMGTIVLNEMIHNYPTLPCSNIVYMAAACTIRDFNLSVVPYLQYHGTNAQFYNLVLHPRNDALERSFGDIPPRGSLLEWIDNFLASPQTPVDRTLGKWENIIQATHTIPPEVRGRVHIKAFGSSRDENFPEGNPQTHGSFGTNQFWRTEFWQPHVPPQSP